MFPLQSVLFPGIVLPLHVFEPRYQQLIKDLSSGPSNFGVVLIARGSEVGGGDQRCEVGTMARLAERITLDDGTSVILAVGVSRIRVRNWLPDDPYPLALVEDLFDPVPQGDEFPELVADLEKRLRYLLLLKDEIAMSSEIPVQIALSSDRIEALWQMCAVAPIPVLDQQNLLCQDEPVRRAEMLGGLIDDAISLFEGQLRD
jgi:Lon protease-like protein